MVLLVSIIIPTYNRAHLLSKTLESILAQTYQNWECIVVDDGSTDVTDALMAEYIAKDSRFQYHHRPANRSPGGNAARNYGFEMSRGAYIQWFDSDDIMHPEKLEKSVAQFLLFPVISVCVCTSHFFTETISVINKTTQLQTKNLFRDYVLKKIRVSCPQPLWSKKFLEGKSLFNPKSLRGQEYELYCQLFYEVGDNYKIVNEPLVYIRANTHSITKNYMQGDKKTILSYFLVLRSVLDIVLKTGEESFYRAFLSIYYRSILFALRLKKYPIVLQELKYLGNNPYKNKCIYKRKFIRDIFVIRLIQFSNGKLYYKLKKYLLLK
jgi:glycosyltransferase involved in cell wall biosynthesis